MNALTQMRIGPRLTLAFAAVLLLMLGVAGVGMHGIFRVAAGLDTV